jgi:LPXTG-motif cell wall-anchored protein
MHRGRLSLVRSAGATVLVLAGVALPLTAAPAAAMDIDSECVPFPARYEKSWETVDASSGRLSRPFGTLAWTRSGVNYEIRNGFAVSICAASIDNKAGISSTASVGLRGPKEGRLPNKDLTGIGFGYVTAPKLPPATLPATGASTPAGVIAAAIAALASGAALIWFSARKRAPRAGSVPTG